MNTPAWVPTFLSRLSGWAAAAWRNAGVRMLIIGLVAGAGFGYCAHADAAPGALAFTPPTTRADGTPMPASEIASYQIGCVYTPTGGSGAACAALTPTSFTGASSGGNVTFTVTQSGRACFSLVTVDTGSRQSAPSNVACKDVVVAAPNPATNVTVAVVIGMNMTPVFKVTATGKRSVEPAGFAALNVACSGNVLFYYRDRGYRRIDPAAVAWWNVVPGTSAAAPCASI